MEHVCLRIELHENKGVGSRSYTTRMCRMLFKSTLVVFGIYIIILKLCKKF